MESPQLSNKESSASISQNAELKTDATVEPKPASQVPSQVPQPTLAQLSSTPPQETFTSEAPLLGLCPKPVHLMTDDEKRKHLAKVRNLRSNFAGWRAGVARDDEKNDALEVPVNTGLEDLL